MESINFEEMFNETGKIIVKLLLNGLCTRKHHIKYVSKGQKKSTQTISIIGNSTINIL